MLCRSKVGPFPEIEKDLSPYFLSKNEVLDKIGTHLRTCLLFSMSYPSCLLKAQELTCQMPTFDKEGKG